MKNKGHKRYDYLGAIMAFEDGRLDHDATVKLFQYLVDTGIAWQLQGSYARQAVTLIEAGFVTSKEHTKGKTL